jgi:hypothetical protein
MSNLTPRIDRLDKNYIINGNLDYWQRGTSLTAGPAAASGNYLADRFRGDFGTSTNSTVVFSRSTDVPDSVLSAYSHLTSVTTAGTISASTDNILPFYQNVEGTFFRQIHKKSVTLSFFVKSSVSGTFAVSLRNGAAPFRSYVTTFTINSANTWEKKVIQVTLDQSGTWSLDNNAGLLVSLCPITGSAFNAPSANTWVDGNFLSVAGVTNWFTNGATLRFSQVMLLEGTHANPTFTLAGRNLAEELQLCQRYYEKSYDVDTPPNSNTVSSSGAVVVSTASVNTSTFISYKVSKRTPAVVTVYDLAGSGPGKVSWYNTSFVGTNNSSAITVPVSSQSQNGWEFRYSNTISGATGVVAHYTADAEL